MSLFKQAVSPPDDDVYDTQEFFGDENVSLGLGTLMFPYKLKDGTVVHFTNLNFKSARRIDERNL